MGLTKNGYGVVTLHRPSNVDDVNILRPLITQLVDISSKLPLVFAVHPRTRKKLTEFDLMKLLEQTKTIMLTDTLGYIQFMNLVSSARKRVLIWAYRA
jgi:UDP-N-acetylglucosamine 2-epimerase (non-hydrolysing)